MHGFLNNIRGFPRRVTREFCINDPWKGAIATERRQRAEAAKRLLWIRMFWVPSISSRVFSRALSAPGIIFVWWKREKRWVGPCRSVLSITNDKSIRSLAFSPPYHSLFFLSFFFYLYNFVTRGAAMIITAFGNEARVADIDFVCTRRWLDG